MTLARTLSLYISRVFVAAVLIVLASLTGIVSLFDFIELLRRSASHPEASFGIVATMASLRTPVVILSILPVAGLLGGLLAVWRLTRSSELIVARASGISAWQFLTAPVFCAVALGAIATGVISPLSSAMFARAEAMDNFYLRNGVGPLAMAGDQLWLRQSDHGIAPQGVAILHARDVSLQGSELVATAVSVFRLDQDRFLERIEARTAKLDKGAWTLAEASVIRPDKMPEPPRTVRLPTDLTVSRVQESFASPNTLSVWELPGFISLLERSGFSAIRHRLRFQELLAIPLLSGTMALVAAGFSMRPSRRGGVARMLGFGAAAGFALFIVSKVAGEFGQSGALPTLLAAWVPSASGLCLALALLLHLEDG